MYTKKLFAAVYSAVLITFFAFSINAVRADVSGLGIGVSISNNDLDTLVTDDIDSNGTITTTKALTDSITAGSIFAELTLGGSSGPLAVTLGIDYIPVDADLDKRSASQASIKGAGSVRVSCTAIILLLLNVVRLRTCLVRLYVASLFVLIFSL